MRGHEPHKLPGCRYCTASSSSIVCNKDAAGTSEEFELDETSTGKFSLKSLGAAKYCKDTGSAVACSSSSVCSATMSR